VDVEPKKNRGGRPRIQIDWDEFDKLCLLQCTLEEIASWFDCSVDTIENRVKREKHCGFSEYSKKRGSKGKISLRRHQWKAAEKGNITMLIWLGKQVLGQSDKPIGEGEDDSSLPQLISMLQDLREAPPDV
jgi:hypothetical protein